MHGKYLTWKSWDHLCLPKDYGGLGFRKAKKTNDASLAKLTWLVLSNKDSICVKALKNKYNVNFDWLQKDPPPKMRPTLGELLRGLNA